MNGLDVVILVIFFASALIGLLRGFTKEILSLFSWGGAISLSYLLLPVGREFVSPYIVNPMMADGIAMFCIFIVSLILLSIVASIMAGYIHESSFRGVDRSLGFGFGMLRGVVFICAGELIFSTFSPRHSQSNTIQSARFIAMARSGGDMLLQVLPSTLQRSIIDQAIKVEQQLQTKVKEELSHSMQGLQGSIGPVSAPGMTHPQAPTGAPDAGEHLMKNDIGYQASSLAGPSVGTGVGTAVGHGVGTHAGSYGGVHTGMPSGSQPLPSSPLPQPKLVYPQGGQVQSGMVVIRPPQPGQAPQLATAPRMSSPIPNPAYSSSTQQSPPPVGVGQSMTHRDRQSTVDELARLKPQSSPREESGYTKGQRDDMDRLFQAAGGE